MTTQSNNTDSRKPRTKADHSNLLPYIVARSSCSRTHAAWHVHSAVNWHTQKKTGRLHRRPTHTKAYAHIPPHTRAHARARAHTHTRTRVRVFRYGERLVVPAKATKYDRMQSCKEVHPSCCPLQQHDESSLQRRFARRWFTSNSRFLPSKQLSLHERHAVAVRTYNTGGHEYVFKDTPPHQGELISYTRMNSIKVKRNIRMHLQADTKKKEKPQTQQNNRLSLPLGMYGLSP